MITARGGGCFKLQRSSREKWLLTNCQGKQRACKPGGGEKKNPNRLCLSPPVFPIKCSGNLWRSGCLSCPSFHLDPACLDPGALSPAVTVKCFFTDGRAKRCYGRKQKGFFWLELNLVWKGDRVCCERRNVLNPECEEYFFVYFFPFVV